ncbi:hypothetical protein PMAYCL1PPCAC_21236, partial [Pristionchus mayeri]
LRKIMRTVEIKDRMRLRLTCRAFEQFMAGTNAGFFEAGSFTWLGAAGATTALSLHIGKSRFIPELLPRLFERIHVRHFKISIIYNPVSHDFIRQIIGLFTIDELEFLVGTNFHLETAIKIAADFPQSKISMELTYVPLEQLLGLIPPMDELSISMEAPQMPTRIILRLLAAHKELCLICRHLLLTAGGWINVMQAISSETRERTFRLVMGKDRMRIWLSNYGITDNAKAGDVVGEFHICEWGDVQLIRYRKCWIRIASDSAWMGVYMRQPTGVTITNVEGIIE